MSFTVTTFVTQGAGTDIPAPIDTNMPILISMHSEGGGVRVALGSQVDYRDHVIVGMSTGC